MSKKEKLLQKFLTVPVRNDLTFNELKTLLQALGFEMKEGKGSRVKFFHNEKKLIVSTHKPHPNPELCEEFIKDVQLMLKIFK
jgi:predicted RNA binding protein YcfA (HicA-like mRNA interferase family)